jgi:hypothetical protein
MSPRRDITMNGREVDSFLATQKRVLVVALAGYGPPIAAMASLIDADGPMSFELAADDPVVGLLAIDDRACCVAEQFPTYFEIRGAMLHGRARRVDPGGGPTALYRLEVDKTVSYDFGKLPEALGA